MIIRTSLLSYVVSSMKFEIQTAKWATFFSFPPQLLFWHVFHQNSPGASRELPWHGLDMLAIRIEFTACPALDTGHCYFPRTEGKWVHDPFVCPGWAGASTFQGRFHFPSAQPTCAPAVLGSEGGRCIATGEQDLPGASWEALSAPTPTCTHLRWDFSVWTSKLFYRVT